MTTEQRTELTRQMEKLMKDANKFKEVSFLAQCVGMKNALETLGYKVETNVYDCTVTISE